jgi:hypothetical protein
MLFLGDLRLKAAVELGLMVLKLNHVSNGWQTIGLMFYYRMWTIKWSSPQ